MKKNDWILIISTAAYSYLFYQQTFGINFLIFNILLIAGLVLKDNAVLKSKNWIAAACGALASSICITIYGNPLSFVANFFSLAILSGYSFSAKYSVVLSFGFTIYSYATAPVYMIIDAVNRKLNTNSNRAFSWARMLAVIIPLLVALVFFVLYQAISPTFYELTQKINLDFISSEWLGFTLFGLILLYGLFYHKRIDFFAEKDEAAPGFIEKKSVDEIPNLENERRSGIILFFILNILLLTVNSLDVVYLYFNKQLPEGITHAQFVHKGVGTLIFSIIIAISIILFYFRGQLNFDEKAKVIKWLTYAWIIQNAFMVVSTIVRNDMYITEFALTYKRIGVYVYLLLALIGLATTFIKIMNARSAWYLVRINSWAYFTVLIISAAFNWDVIITDFNMKNSSSSQKILDEEYLIDLSYRNLPQLMNYATTQENHLKEKYSTERTWLSDNSNTTLEQKLQNKLNEFHLLYKYSDWQSWCYYKSKVYKETEQYLNKAQ